MGIENASPVKNSYLGCFMNLFAQIAQLRQFRATVRQVVTRNGPPVSDHFRCLETAAKNSETLPWATIFLVDRRPGATVPLALQLDAFTVSQVLRHPLGGEVTRVPRW